MKICMISLGCDKNLVDSEMMLGYLRREDVSLTDEQAEADVIIVNTCAFILDAKDESIQTMLGRAIQGRGQFRGAHYGRLYGGAL